MQINKFQGRLVRLIDELWITTTQAVFGIGNAD
jgi:hypothetical protein